MGLVLTGEPAVCVPETSIRWQNSRNFSRNYGYFANGKNGPHTLACAANAPITIPAYRRFLIRLFSMTLIVGFVALTIWIASSPEMLELHKADKQTNATMTKLFDERTPAPHHRPHGDLQRQQVENYMGGSGLILNIHITHHGGTTFCRTIGRLGPSPSFACMGVNDEDNVTNPDYPRLYPWRHNETAENIAIVRKYFHMISWEWNAVARPSPPLNEDRAFRHHAAARALSHSSFLALNISSQ